jgi:demethylmenaquinone methyltransferase/2-methoxy-6-polyprenyl-1,4-benzoquinol methylase
MFSYILMKILESRPNQYDRGLVLLSLGQSERVKRRIVEEHVHPGVRMLEIGVGTGALAVMAARKGAKVVGFDISEDMLRVARQKMAAANLNENTELMEMGVGGMDTFEDESFDLVLATLVFSELSPDEQAYALRHAWRVLRPGGRLVVADEVKPRQAGKRLLHGLVRAPLAVITYAFSGSTTRAVKDLKRLAQEAGFTQEHLERSGMDAFLYLVARKR